MINVVNKRAHKPSAGDEYVGRPSPLGNPFSHLAVSIAKYQCATRDESIAKFAVWLDEQLKSDTPARREIERLQAKWHETGTLTLVCWCKPASCHGDIIAARIRGPLPPLAPPANLPEWQM